MARSDCSGRRGRRATRFGALVLLLPTALAGCQSLPFRSETAGWPRYESRIGEHVVRYRVPPDGRVLRESQAEVDPDFPRREIVWQFAVFGYDSPPNSRALPPTRISFGIGRVPGGPLPAAPSAKELGDRVVRQASMGGRPILYHGDVVEIGDQSWFRLENDVQGSGGVQPEAVIYYAPLDGRSYLFVWGFWAKSVRQTTDQLAAHRATLARIVANTDID